MWRSRAGCQYFLCCSCAPPPLCILRTSSKGSVSSIILKTRCQYPDLSYRPQSVASTRDRTVIWDEDYRLLIVQDQRHRLALRNQYRPASTFSLLLRCPRPITAPAVRPPPIAHKDSTNDQDRHPAAARRAAPRN